MPNGSNVAFLSSGVAGAIHDELLRQTLAKAVRAETLYTLSSMLGRGFDDSVPAGSIFVDLLAGNTVLTSRQFNGSDLAVGQFSPYALSFAIQSAGSTPITIQFRSIFSGFNFTQAFVDDVRLDASPDAAAAVPETSTCFLIHPRQPC